MILEIRSKNRRFIHGLLERENRLIDTPIEINATSLNFKPQMDPETVVEGYLRVIGTIYDSTLENYFDRCLTLLENLNPVPHLHKPVSQYKLFMGIMGIRQRMTSRQQPAFSRFIATVSKNHPRLLPLAVSLAATGYHCEKITRQHTVMREFKQYLTSELARIEQAGIPPMSTSEAVDKLRQQALYRINTREKTISEEFRYAGDGITKAISDFQQALDTMFDRALADDMPLA